MKKVESARKLTREQHAAIAANLQSMASATEKDGTIFLGAPQVTGTAREVLAGELNRLASTHLGADEAAEPSPLPAPQRDALLAVLLELASAAATVAWQDAEAITGEDIPVGVEVIAEQQVTYAVKKLVEAGVLAGPAS